MYGILNADYDSATDCRISVYESHMADGTTLSIFAARTYTDDLTKPEDGPYLMQVGSDDGTIDYVEQHQTFEDTLSSLNSLINIEADVWYAPAGRRPLAEPVTVADVKHNPSLAPYLYKPEDKAMFRHVLDAHHTGIL